MNDFFNKLLEDVKKYQQQSLIKGFKVVGIILNSHMIELLKQYCNKACESDFTKGYSYVGYFTGIPVIEMEGSYKIRYIIESEEGL